jgi:predicted ribosomally synthesized peptide with nif11-like leader
MTMSAESATAFLERAESDEAFARDLESVKDDPAAVLAKVRDAGYDVNQDEVKDAFLDRYGAVLTEDQLDTIAAGVDGGMIAGAVVGGLAGAAMVVAICAAYAA